MSVWSQGEEDRNVSNLYYNNNDSNNKNNKNKKTARRTYIEEGLEGLEVEVVGEDLDEDLHEVLLRDLVAAVDHLFGDAGQDRLT